VLADYGYNDQLYDQNAWGRSVLFHIDDGVADGDRTEDTYLIASQLVQDETYQQTLARHFPTGVFDNGPDDPRTGTLTNIRTPEFDGSGEITGWFDHPVGPHAWWEVAISAGGETSGTLHFKDMPAKAKTDVYLRYLVDSDGDGYTDIAEKDAFSDPNNADIHPRPLLIAAQHTDVNSNTATVQLSLQNNGNFDASSVEVWAVAPNDSIAITDNLIGGGGRVRSGSRVVIGARIGAPDLTTWITSTTKPYLSGQFQGLSAKTYIFRADTSGTTGSTVGLTISWTDDGATWTPLNVGSGYTTQNPIAVADGVNVAFTAGTIRATERFTVETALPIDTFAYTINRTPYTPPLIVVSYNDPQGNHKFASGVEIPEIQVDLTPYQGMMRYGLELDALNSQPFQLGANTTYFLFNNPTDTPILGGKLFAEMATPDGTVAHEYVVTDTIFQPGPNIVPLNWNTLDFTPTFSATQDYHVLVFVTDRQGTIIENTVKDFDALGRDRLPTAVIPSTAWDFGTVTQGEILNHTFTIANTGFTDLLAYISAQAEIGLSQQGSKHVSPGDMAEYVITLDTSTQAVGAFSRILTLRTSDPTNPTRTFTVLGNIVAPSGAANAFDLTNRPWDKRVMVYGNVAQYTPVDFAENIQPDSASIEPCMVYAADGTTLKGTGKYCADFGGGVSSGQMFGDGSDGDVTVTSPMTFQSPMSALASTASAGQTIVNTAAFQPFESGWEILIVQIQGTGVGTYEFATVASRNGNQTTLTQPLLHTYTQSGNSKAFAVRVPHFRNVAVTSSGQWLAPAWNGSEGGIIVFRASGFLTVATGGSIDLSARGFRGGPWVRHQHGYQGEGTPGAGGQVNPPGNANGNGGGGGRSDASAGGGGGNGTDGGTGAGSGEGPGGDGGITSGSADLSVMTLGGGGGGGTADWNAPAYGGDGAAGGASAIIFAQNVTVGGTLTSFGGNGNNGFAPGGTDQDDGFGGAGGAGGSILLKAQNASVGTNLISAIGGSGGNGCDNGMCGRYAGNGGIGRIRIEYCDTLSGTTNPPASTQKLTCYIAEKTSDTNVHFTVPDVITNGQNYVMHFGRHFTFGVSGGTIMTPTRLMAQNYANATMDALVTNVGAGGSTNLQVMVGTQTIYSASQTITQPTSISLNNFASALNAYLASQPANTLIDVPMTVTLDRQADVMLTNLALTPGANVDASIVTGDIAFGTLTPTEGASVPITLTLHNTGNIDSGGLTAAVFATPTLGSAWYIGSVYVPNIPANGTTQATIQWDTLGFTGTTPVRVVVDPYNRIAEADENNNTVATTLTIRTQPDLNFAALTLFNDEPVTSELVTVTLPLHNLGQTAAGAHSVALYQGNPDAGGILIGAVNQSGLAGNTTTPITFTWTPTATGSYRLFARADRNGQVNEADEGNNDLWKDVYVGIRGPILIDSGAASDEPYTGTIGYGYVDLGQPDVIVPCGSQSHETLRMDPGGQIGYRFDHLLPGHFYHLDVTLYECDGAGRQESIFVDGNRIAGPEELIDGRVHRLSLRLDPALYADRTISITIEAPGIDGAVVSAINLFDIDYRYANAGGVNDPAYPGGRWTNFGRAYGYTNGVTNTLWGTLPYSSVHVNQISNTVYYRFDGLLPVKQYQINLTFWQPSGAAREQKVQIDGTDTSTTINTGDYQLHQLALDIPNNTYGDGRIDVGIVRTNAATGAFVNEIALEELTAVLPPVTNFTALPTSGYAPLPVQFTDQSSGAVTSRAWYFGDGGTATIPNPLHTYQSPGVYDVSLATTGPGGTDILTRSHYITVTAITTQTVVRIQPPVASASVGSPITVAVMISNVANLGSFQFTLGFNPTRVQVQAVTLGEFPGSTGRSFTPIGPTIDNTNGTAIFGAFSLGGTPPGPNGSGNLAYVRLQPISGGTSVLALSNVQVSNVAGSSLPFITQDGLLSIAACLGDFDGDGDVDILDVQRVAYRWGSHTGQPLYDSLYDVEPLGAPDGDIDILDVQVVAYRWGTHCSTGRSARLLAATAPATLSIQPYSRTVSATQTFTTTVWISDVADLGAFEFTLAYSPTVIEVMSATIASFPTSTGRAFTPAGLIISPTGSTATYGAFSLGATPPGANGNGALAIVTLKALSAGQSNLNFNAAQISDRSGAAQVIGSMLDGMIEVVAQTEWKVYLPLVQK
ncbi:partial Protease 1, partial [Anaerolineae bacterium]